MNTAAISSPDVLEKFAAAMREYGIEPPDELIADGRLHRFSTNGKKSDAAGYYVLHLDGLPAGHFADFRTGIKQDWHADPGRTLTDDEKAATKKRVGEMRAQRQAEEARVREEAAARASAVWSKAQPAGDEHPYLLKKGIKAHGARQYGDALVIPLSIGGEIVSLQFVSPDGSKKSLTGGTTKAARYVIGRDSLRAAILAKANGVICVAEGFATAASIFEATGRPVFVAFNAGNLLPVAKEVRRQYGEANIVICADDDYRTAGNPGRTKAVEAARAIGGLVAIPDFGDSRPDGATDFNDLHAARGPEAVREAVEAAIAAGGAGISTDHAGPPNADPAAVSPNSDVADVAAVQASNDARLADTEGDTAGVAAVAESPIPKLGERRFVVLDDFTDANGTKYRPGVWWFSFKEGKDTLTPIEEWVCSPMYVEAVTFDGQENNFGRLLRFRNTLGRWREWAMPMELLKASGDELRGELLAMGVSIDPGGHRLLTRYLQSVTPIRRVRCALQVGWCDDAYVLPDEVIGANGANIIFQSGERGHDEHTRGGTLAGWRSEIAARAVGNPWLALALSASFSGPLLARCNAESGGIHFVGDSSTGKTTLIEAACATWGGENYKRSWRATANGMEGAAVLFNDGLLALDEISEADPREVGAIVYALGNGKGKQRASRTGAARGVVRWRCVVLSSGERTIGTTMAEVGARAKAGQLVRLLDVPAVRRSGVFEDLHGLSSGTALADALKSAAKKHFGHAGREYLQRLTRDSRDFGALLDRIKALPAFAQADAEGQEKRAAARFALFALAGEVATEYGVTGWPEGAAIHAAAEAFKAWRAARGRGNDERRQVLDRVAEFVEKHGDSRFSDADRLETADAIRVNRAGWWRGDGADRRYLFTASGLREALTGFDYRRALDVLQSAGAIPEPRSGGERSTFERIGGRGVKVYAVNPEKLRGES